MTEVWKPVVGFEGLYEVSDLGRVRSLDRVVRRLNRWGQVSDFFCRGRLIRSGPHQGGYLSIHLYRGGEVKSTTAHVLVAEAFIGPRPAGMEVCHNDGDKKNCAASNLRYDTPSGNNQDKEQHGTARKGDNHQTAKLTTTAVLAIRASREPQQVLADRFGCTFSNISAIQLRKSWRHV